MYRFTISLNKEIHLDNFQVALFNYICAKQNKQNFLVRIEDSNKTKNTEGKDAQILDILAIFGMGYDGLYYQSENFKYHLQFASYLMDKGKAFACFCSEKELKKSKKYSGKCINISQDELLNNNLPFVIRIKKPTTAIDINDAIKGKISFNADEIDSFVVMNQDKYPTHNFACACDDMIQGVKNVIIKKDDILDTAKQEFVRHSLGYHETINYVTLPSLINDEEELNTNNIKWLLDQGFMPEAIVNYLILLGSQTPCEVFTLDDALSWFDITTISDKPVKFDMIKLRFINKEHIKNINDIELSKRIGYSCAKIGQLAKLYGKEVSTTLEIKEKVDTLFSKKEDKAFEDSLKTLKDVAKDAPYFEEFDDFKVYLSQKSGLKEEELSKPLYFLLTGAYKGPNINEIYPLIKNYLQEIIK